MKSDHIRIGPECSVGNMAVVLYGTVTQQGSSLAPLSVLMKGETLPAGSCWCGIPTRPVDAVPVAETCERAAAATKMALG